VRLVIDVQPLDPGRAGLVRRRADQSLPQPLPATPARTGIPDLEGRAAVRFPVSPDTPCCRADVVGGDLPPTPPQVVDDCPGEQKNDWDKKNQHKAHHDLLLEMFSAYASCCLAVPVSRRGIRVTA
jgi:hypothetical protein